MIKIVFTEDDEWPLGRQATINQCLRNAARSGQRLGIAQVLPVAGAAITQALPLGDESVIGRGLRPVHQSVRHALGVRLQVLLGANVNVAVARFLHYNAAHAKFQLAVAWRRGLFRRLH